MRWWDLDQVMPIEAELFGADRWSAGMFWAELAQPDSRHYLVAVDPDDLVVGYAGLCTFGDEGYIQTVGVTGRRQRAGIGRALLEALLLEADRRGARTIVLEVRADNAVAQRLYARYGFEPVGVRRRYYQPSGTDAVVMIRAS
jgi:ribosomal-protein-alanine N-acetyltransferase